MAGPLLSETATTHTDGKHVASEAGENSLERTSSLARDNESHDIPHTGLDTVDRLLEESRALDELQLSERAGAYARLRDTLEAILDEQPGALPSGLAGLTGPSGLTGLTGPSSSMERTGQ